MRESVGRRFLWLATMVAVVLSHDASSSANTRKAREQAPNEWPATVRKALWNYRSKISLASLMPIPFPKQVKVPGYEPAYFIGGGSAKVYLTRNRRHVIKVYARPGLAAYEYWATQFFNSHDVPVAPIIYHSPGLMTGKRSDAYIVGKPYLEGFSGYELHPRRLKTMGLDKMGIKDPGHGTLVDQIKALHGPAFGQFLQEKNVDPGIFGHHNRHFITKPGDIGRRLWDNILLLPKGWVLIDP